MKAIGQGMGDLITSFVESSLDANRCASNFDPFGFTEPDSCQ
jgi:hypothetical protein